MTTTPDNEMAQRIMAAAYKQASKRKRRSKATDIPPVRGEQLALFPESEVTR